MSPWDEVRRDFPALSRHVYLNAAAASPTPRPVREAVARFYRELEEDGDGRWDEWLARREEIRAGVARFINAEPDEIAFTPNTSAGINLIVDLLEKDGDVLSDELEFPTVTLPWIHRGVRVHFLPARAGVIEPGAFARDDAPEAAVVAVSHVQFSNGCRLDLDGFGRTKGPRRLVVCGSQALGAFAVDVKRSRIDAFATAGHKWLCAGYGAGFAYISRALLERPPREMGWLSVEDPYAFDNREYRLLPGARRSELGCPPFGPIFGLGAAIDYLAGIGAGAIEARVLELNAHLTTRLERAGLRSLSPGGAHRSGQTLVALDDPPRAAAFLRSRGVLVTEKPLGVRIATHFYNTEEDVERCLAALSEYARP
ncbi:MAG TPA: aminotransferase class V-fold PLP-dependent enzyme [Vicinamibacteria bacterium]|nr:aminotransferase class V-fold PLP-dependent enzyme [Vicinamibacteria bacterium]